MKFIISQSKNFGFVERKYVLKDERFLNFVHNKYLQKVFCFLFCFF